MKRVRFVAPARREFLEGVRFYEAEEAGLGARFAAAVEAAAARVVAFPSSGSPASESTRRVIVASFPFSVVYREEEGGILIFALAHHSRRPGYWKERLREG